MSPSASGFLRGLSAVARAGVNFVLVGVGGINFYAKDPAHAHATLDVDLLLAPEIENLRLALAALADAGFRFDAGGEPFLDVDAAAVLENIIRSGANLTARHDDGAQLDLMLSMIGFTYPDLAADASIFAVEGTELRVGRLEKLLRS